MSRESEPERPVRRGHPVSNLATALALVALLLAMAGILGFLGAVGLPGVFIGVGLVFVGGGLLVGFHYVTWGWMMTHLRDEEDESP